jgi:hypothetical protein
MLLCCQIVNESLPDGKTLIDWKKYIAGYADLVYFLHKLVRELWSTTEARGASVADSMPISRSTSSLVASTAALIATGWSEPVPGRVYPRQCLHGAPGLLVTCFQFRHTVERFTPLLQFR